MILNFVYMDFCPPVNSTTDVEDSNFSRFVHRSSLYRSETVFVEDEQEISDSSKSLITVHAFSLVRISHKSSSSSCDCCLR